MKTILFTLLTFAAIGCGHNEFDVSPAQVSRHKGTQGPEGADQIHMPPGPAKMFKKGDRLPDGTIADQNVKISSDGR